MLNASGETSGRPWSVIHILDVCLLLGFLLEAIIAKSQFDKLIGGWRGHMILTVCAIGLLLVRGFCLRDWISWHFEPSRHISALLAAGLIWAVICCIVQPNAYANLIFLSVYAANIYVCLYIAPNLILGSFGQYSILLYALPVFAVTLINPFYQTVHNGMDNYRLSGITDNATHSGALSAMAAILALWMALEWKRGKLFWLAVCIASSIALIMTRTRASIVGWAVGSIAMIVYYGRWRPRANAKLNIVFALIATFLLLGIAVVSTPDLVERTRIQLRVNDREHLFSSRMKYWKFGVDHIVQYPWFGEGPMARFGNTNDPTVNTYVEDNVFCSTWLAFAQAYGIPGALIFALVCMKMYLEGIKKQVAFPLLLVGLMVSNVVSSIGFSWVVSFGTPSDRASWLLTGLALAVTSPKSVTQSRQCVQLRLVQLSRNSMRHG